MLKEVNKEVSQRLNNNSDAEAIQNYSSQKLMETAFLQAKVTNLKEMIHSWNY